MAKLMEYKLTFSDCSTSSNVVFFFMAKVIIIYLNVKNPGISWNAIDANIGSVPSNEDVLDILKNPPSWQ